MKDSIYMIIGMDTSDGAKIRWGYYPSLEEAEKVVFNNYTDIYETCYDIVIIERICPGIIPITMDWFYKWNKENECYERISTPIECLHQGNYFM